MLGLQQWETSLPGWISPTDENKLQSSLSLLRTRLSNDHFLALWVSHKLPLQVTVYNK